MLEARMDYPKHAVWQFLQPLVKEGLVVRYEPVELPHAGQQPRAKARSVLASLGGSRIAPGLSRLRVRSYEP